MRIIIPQTRYKLQLGEIDLSKIAITYQDKTVN
jgi:hypothetical protein